MPIDIYLALIDKGVPHHDANTLVCIAHHESKLKPGAINHHNSNGTKDYGLFQINSIWKKPCGLSAKQLLDSKKNLTCAVHVYNKQGLKAWVTYPKCANRQVSTSTASGTVSTVITQEQPTEERVHWLVKRSLNTYIWIAGTLKLK
jgi:C-type lysozyme/alpha-lactalbumin family protein